MAKEIVITSDAHSKVMQAAHFLEDNLYGKLTTAGSALEDVGSFLYAWKARKAHWKIQEMPVDWDHQSNSKIRLLSDGLAMGWEVLQMRIYFWKRSLFKSKIHEKRN